MPTLLHQLLSAAHIKHTREFTLEVFSSEPNNNTLLGLKRLLGQYGIQAKGVRTERENLNSYPYPYVMHIKNDFHLVASKTDLKEEFFEQWDGILLYLSDKSAAIEPDYYKHARKELLNKVPQIALGLAAPLVALSGLNEWVMLTTALLGLALGVLLLQKQLNEGSKTGDKICSLFQKHGCDAVLSSDKAKVLGLVSLSEVGTGYFWAQLLLLGTAPNLLGGLWPIAAMGMVFPIWSVYSQWRMKRWCGLCLLTQVLLLVQGAWALSQIDFLLLDTQWLTWSIETAQCGLLLIAGMLGAHFVAEAIQQRRNALSAGWHIRWMHRQPAYFMEQMQKSELHNYLPTDVTNRYGNPEAEQVVAIYLSHTCPHCVALKPEIDRFIELHSDRFTVELLYAQELSEEEEVAFAKRTGLNATPTLMLNGYQLPDGYQLSDLPYLFRN